MRVKELRVARELTQGSLAKTVGIHRVYLAQIEGGVKTPSLPMLSKIAKALKVKVTELLA